MKFYKKDDAIRYYDKLKNKEEYKLIQEDIDVASSKCFHVIKPEILFKLIEEEEKPHYYEFWTENTKLLFSIDLDYNNIKSEMSADKLLEKIINFVIEGAKTIYNHEYKIEDIIILENDNNDKKYSAHIIFLGLNFSNFLVCKDFYMKLDKLYEISKFYVDKSIYGMKCLRLYLNSKMGINHTLIMKKLLINNKSTKTIQDNNYNFFLDTMITETSEKNITIIDVKYKNNKEYKKYKNDIDVEQILNELPEKYYDEHEYWIKIGMILYNTNDNLFELWNKWSAKSNKYKEYEMKKIWNNFKKTNLSLGTLIKWAKDEDIVITNSLEKIIENCPEKSIDLNLNKYPTLIIDQPKLTPEIYNNIIDNRLICIQSEKGTGKTTNLFDAILKHDDGKKSILFISSRITFGFKLYGDLKKYGFELYSQCTDHYIKSNRIICQIDSLLRLENDIQYDIVIIDECESFARYITSSHFSRNLKSDLIISSFDTRLIDANKIFIMDADLSDRSINYYTNVLQIKTGIHIVVNNYRPAKEYMLVSCKFATWIRKINLYISKNKRLIIAMASNNKAKNIKEDLTLKFPNKKILLINVEMDQKEKEKYLLNVNDTWSQYDIIIYTPSVNMGISYDIENYFDNIFCYGCNNSITSQELFQMIHRIRSPKSNKIYISMDNYKSYNEDNDDFTYKIIENMISQNNYLSENELHTNIIKRKYDNKNIIYPYKDEPIYDLYVRNCKEILENRTNFTASFYGYAKYKRYNLEYLEKVSEEDKEIHDEFVKLGKEKKVEEKNNIINNIIKANNITKEEYNEINNKKDKILSQEDFYKIEKYNFIKCYDVSLDICKFDFLDKNYDKTKMKHFRNITTILNKDEQTTEIKLNILRTNYNYNNNNNCYQKLTQNNQYLYHSNIINILDSIGFNINMLDIEIEDNEDFFDKLIILNKWFNDNRAELILKYNVNIEKKNFDLKINRDKINNKIISYVNKLLKNYYGFNIKKKNKKYKLYDNDKILEYRSKIKKLEYKNINSSSDFNINKIDDDLFED